MAKPVTKLIRDLIGTAPLRVDIRTRYADGRLMYPEQQKQPRLTTLRHVWTEKIDGFTWLMWDYDKLPCHYEGRSGIVLTSKHAAVYSLQVHGPADAEYN